MVSAIVLAAGLSSRMGEQNKLLLDFRGQPLIRHVVSQILESVISEVIVVLGHESDQVQKALHGLQVDFVWNEKFRDGMTSSIQAGVQVSEAEGYMICLSDMYAITPADYNGLINFFNGEHHIDPHCICIPAFNGKKGNPVIFSSSYRDTILHHADPEGCRKIVMENEAHLRKLTMENANVLQDLDFPEDYLRLQND